MEKLKKQRMRKVLKQIIINIFIAALSFVVIFFGKCLELGRGVTIRECIDSDFIFLMLSSLIAMLGWRVADNISGDGIGIFMYNSIAVFECCVLMILYGISIIGAIGNIMHIIRLVATIFIIIYFAEIFIIYFHFKNLPPDMDSLTYARAEERGDN